MHWKTTGTLFSVLFFTFFLHSQPSPLLNSCQTWQASKANTLFHLQWISAGPVVNSARVEAVQADPTHPGTIYVAFGSGNLWKTANNGLTWKPIFEDQPALGIGDIALAPSNPEVIYVGTGESLRKNRNFTMPGAGVYRSDDGGSTWRRLGLEDTWHIGEIAVHPTDPDIALVAAMGKFWTPSRSMGIYRTDDGGKTWQRTLFVDEHTRANDVVISPSDPDIVYASMWENNDNPNISESVYGPNSGIYRSADGGKSWQRLTNGLPLTPKTGRIGLAVSYTDPDKVYALIDNRNNLAGDASEVYKTVDGGKSWTRSHTQPLMIFPGVGWYFADIYVNPQDDEEIFALGVRMAHSVDGGKTFDLIGGKVEHLQPSMAQTLHLDQCELWIDPSNPDHLLSGNDGGLYQSYDKGATWLHLNNIPAGEFYQIALDNRQPYLIYGGTQDDATVYGPAREWDNTGKDPWKYLWIDAWSGGDGCYSQVDPDDPNTVYFSMQDGAAMRKDLAADTSVGISPRNNRLFRNKLKYNFVAPYILSPHNSRTIYHGGNYLAKSTDRGDTWTMISPDLSVSADSMKQSVAAGAVEESRLKAGLLYVGTDHGAFWTSRDDGANWTEHSNGLPMAYIRSICASRHAESRVYVALTGLNYDDLSHHLFASEDYGATWTSIAANLPDEPVNVILEDPVFEDILYAGVYRGVYISTDRGKSWQRMGENLPGAAVADLKIQEREHDLIAATHGRGIWFVNLDPVREMYRHVQTSVENKVFPIPAGRYPKFRDTHRDVDEGSLTKIPISFWLKAAETVQLSVVNEKGEIVWQDAWEGKRGLNQFRWDMVTDRVASDLPYFIHYKRYLRRGAYTFRVKTAEGHLDGLLRVE